MRRHANRNKWLAFFCLTLGLFFYSQAALDELAEVEKAALSDAAIVRLQAHQREQGVTP